MHHDCPVKKSHCQFANQVEWKFELVAGNSSSLLGAQKKNIGNALQSDVTQASPQEVLMISKLWYLTINTIIFPAFLPQYKL